MQIRVAEDEKIGRHVALLPSDIYTLDRLRGLSDGRFSELIEAGRIHPGMKRNEGLAETRDGRYVTNAHLGN